MCPLPCALRLLRFQHLYRDLGRRRAIGDYAPSVLAEASLAARVMAEAGLPERAARTVFFGGGTPTMLDAAELIAILEGLRARVGIDRVPR